MTYKIDVLDMLKKEGYTQTTLRKEKLIGQDAIQKMRKGSEKAEYGEHQQRNEAETERASQKMRPHRGSIAGNLPLPV